MAIVMKVMQVAYESKVEKVILVAGDGDFIDLINFVKKTLHKEIFIVGYQHSMSNTIIESIPSANLLYLDSLWPKISAN